MLRTRVNFDSIGDPRARQVAIKIIDHLPGCVFVCLGTAKVHLAPDLPGVEMWRVFGINAQTHTMQ